MKKTQSNSTDMLTAGIDFHKRYSVAHILDAEGGTVRKGRIEPNSLASFESFFSGFEKDQVRCVFEASMNWGYLYDLLYEIEQVADVTMAHPLKTRVIAEAQVKTDKLDAHWLAELHRVGLIAEAHASSQNARRRKELLRQRCFFVRQRTSIRNRVHNLLGSQRDLKKVKRGMTPCGKFVALGPPGRPCQNRAGRAQEGQESPGFRAWQLAAREAKEIQEEKWSFKI